MDYSFILEWDTGPMCTTTYQLTQLMGKEGEDIEKTLYFLECYGMKLGQQDQLNTYGDTPSHTGDIDEYIETLKSINHTTE